MRLQFRNLAEVDYQIAWQLQRELHARRVADEAPDTVLLLEHPFVYTAGRRTEVWERPTDGSPVIDVDRGGRLTWHGPGQLVGYPIVRLPDPVDVVAYVRTLEAALIDACAQLGVRGERVAGRSGVWVRGDGRDRKIAAIGVRVSRGVTMHGFALNVCPDLSAFDRIVPCGITDATVTSLSRERHLPVDMAGVRSVVEEKISDVLGAHIYGTVGV
ncbi:MAG: lipoyl(octanoyl) transferase LipB [Mycobacteriales bacterium]